MRVFFLLLMLTLKVMANDALEGKTYADSLRQSVLQSLQHVSPSQYLESYNPNPPQQNIPPESLSSLGQQQLKTDALSQSLVEQNKNKNALDMNSNPMREGGEAIQNAEGALNGENLPCREGNCLATPDEDSTDFSEGIAELGVLTEEGKSVSRPKKNKKSMYISVFGGANNTCRIAVAGIGNCCGGHAHLLNCRPGEKELAQAINDHRAHKVGKYCAHKVLTCLEEKESWCVFPTKLASVFQIQGRLGQLGINFGWAGDEDNRANCRGLTPQELQRIRLDTMDLSSVSQEFERKVKPKSSQDIESKARARIDAMQGTTP